MAPHQAPQLEDSVGGTQHDFLEARELYCVTNGKLSFNNLPEVQMLFSSQKGDAEL